jgi:hypothetical protein
MILLKYRKITACLKRKSVTYYFLGRDSSVGIATGYKQGGPEIETRCGVSVSKMSKPAAFNPGNIPRTHFCYRLILTQGHDAAGMIM